MHRKIVFFTTGMSAGGSERVIANLANFLAERDYKVVIAMLKGKESAYELHKNVELLSATLTPGLRNLRPAIGFYRMIVKQESPDIVVSFSTKSDVVALLSRVLFSTPVGLVVSERNDPLSRVRYLQFAVNFLYRWSDILVCQSEAAANYYRRRLSGKKVFTIPNPLSTNAISEPHLGDRSATILCVGRLYPQKNHQLAIKAFRNIHNVFPDLRLKIFGAGPLEPQLQQLIVSQGLDGVVTLEGVVTDVIRKNSDAALFLFTSDYEGVPNALLEAVATGIPSVTTDFSPGTAGEIIENGVDGYVVPAGDQVALQHAMIKALSGELRPEKLKLKAALLRTRHDTSRVLETWIKLLGAL